MSIRNKRRAADRLVQQFETERRIRKRHTANAMAIVRRRITSPAGLALCFGAGAVVGYRGADHRTARCHDQDDGFLRRVAEGPLGSILLRLAAATIVRAMLHLPGGEDGGDAATAEPTALADVS